MYCSPRKVVLQGLALDHPLLFLREIIELDSEAIVRQLLEGLQNDLATFLVILQFVALSIENLQSDMSVVG